MPLASVVVDVVLDSEVIKLFVLTLRKLFESFFDVEIWVAVRDNSFCCLKVGDEHLVPTIFVPHPWSADRTFAPGHGCSV